MKTAILALLACLFAFAAAAAPCGNCDGERIVGPGPVRLPCPVCAGSGTVPDAPRPTADNAGAPAKNAGAPAAEGPHRPRPAVARVSVAHGKLSSAGSGVLVRVSGSSGIILTNYHVVRENRGAVAVAWPDGTRSTGRAVAWDSDWDLAAVVIPRPAAQPVPIAAAAPRIGDRLTIAGYGPTGHYLEQTGDVTMYAGPGRGRPQQWVECRAAARNGDSGGPMFDAAGELAGVLFGSRDGLTIGSCSTRLRAFLAAVPDAGPAAAARATIECQNGRCRHVR